MTGLPVQPMPDSNGPGWTLEHTDGLTYMLWAPRPARAEHGREARSYWAAHVCRTLDGEPCEHRRGFSLAEALGGFSNVVVRQAFRDVAAAYRRTAEVAP